MGWSALLKKRFGWTVINQLRLAKEMIPELLAHLNDDVPRCGAHSTAGPELDISERAVGVCRMPKLTVLSERASVVIARVPVSATVMREFFNKQLQSLGFAPSQSNQRARICSAHCGHSRRRCSRFFAGTHTEWQQNDLQQNLAHKIPYMQHGRCIPDRRVFKLDETSCRIPSATWAGAP